MPTISVVIPVYNGEKTIQAAVTSVLNQTFQDFELLIINDGSQDQTLDIISNIQDDRIQIFSFPNAGLAASRNRGIHVSTSDYISFLDADDEWTPDKLEAQFQCLDAAPQAGLAYSWTQFTNTAGQPLHPGICARWSGNVHKELLTYFFIENGSNALFRKSVFDQIGTFDESLTAAEDWDMCLRVAARYEFVVVPVIQVLYRQPEQSMSSNVLNQEQETLKVLRRAFAQAPPSLQPLQKQSLANLYQYLLFKAVAGEPSRRRAIAAARFFGTAIAHDPTLLKRRTKLMSIIGLKILGAIVLPSKPLKSWLKRANS